MSRLYLALNGYKSGKAIFFLMLKRYRRTSSFRYLWTSCGTPTSSEHSLSLLVFLPSNTCSLELYENCYGDVYTRDSGHSVSHKAVIKASLKDPKKKAVPLLIPYGQFTKMIIYYLGSTSDVHKRPESPCHLLGDDFLLGTAPVGGVVIRDPVFETTTNTYLNSSGQVRRDQTPHDSTTRTLFLKPEDDYIRESGSDIRSRDICSYRDQAGSDRGKIHMSHQTFTSTPLVIAPVIDFSSPKPSSQVIPPPINTEATTITTSLPEITPFIALQLRVAKLEQDMRRHDSGASASAQPPPKDSDASASKQHPTLTSTGWQITNTRDVVIDSLMHNSESESGHSEHSSDDVSKQDEGHISDLEDTDNTHIPRENRANAYATFFRIKFPVENKLQREMYDIGHSSKWFCSDDQERRSSCQSLIWKEVHPGQDKLFHHNFLNKDLEYLLTGDKEQKTALSISKLKASPYLYFGLEELVTSLWLKVNGIMTNQGSSTGSHLVVQKRRKEFYINKHSEPSDREAVRSQMRILSVIRVKTFKKYGYNYLREIILRRADYKEYKISKKDFKNLHPNDFEDLYLSIFQDKNSTICLKSHKISLYTPAVNMWIRNLVIRNRVGDLQLRIESYQTKLNLERPNWDATDYFFKEDYTIVPKPRAVIYRDRNVSVKVDEGMETRKWSEDDKRRSKDIHLSGSRKRLQIRRIFQSLESFVGGRIRDIDYRLINRTT
ncbi:hypothetical protein Tco_1533774 [Tanacetum coccineum]